MKAVVAFIVAIPAKLVIALRIVSAVTSCRKPNSTNEGNSLAHGLESRGRPTFRYSLIQQLMCAQYSLSIRSMLSQTLPLY